MLKSLTRVCVFPAKWARSGLGVQPIAAFNASAVGQPRRKPFPYECRRYTFVDQLFMWDYTVDHLQENSLIFVVDGNIGAGKSSFAQELAKKIGFLYVKEPDIDQFFYTTSKGVSLRQLNTKLPNVGKFFSLDDWYEHPSDKRAASQVQYLTYFARYIQYYKSLLHLLSTAQGVVLDRSVFSDQVFAKAMRKNGYLSDPFMKFYERLRELTLTDIWEPHLVIYLDRPVDQCLESIRKRGRQSELKTKVLNPKYLQAIEDGYKNDYLPARSRESEVLAYNWEQAKSVDMVIEDIERVDFNNKNKFTRWRHSIDDYFDGYRKWLNDDYKMTMRFLSVCDWIYLPEMVVPQDIEDKRNLLKLEVKGLEYADGFNADVGDTGIYLNPFKREPPRHVWH